MIHDIEGSLKNLLSGNIDALRGPYSTVTAACLAIPNNIVADKSFRLGKFAEIGTEQPYVTHWWRDGYDDNDLVPYIDTSLNQLEYKGAYNASTNIPSISDVTGQKGWVYDVIVNGTRNFGSGNITLLVGDQLKHDGLIWNKIPAPDIANKVSKGGDSMTGALIIPSNEVRNAGQALTTYNNTKYPVKSYVGHVGNPELNCSFNMDYNKPGLEGVHLYTNSAYPAIWTAHGLNGFYIQMAKAGLTQTGFLRASVVGGSGYVTGIYNVSSIENITGTGTGANATVYINGGSVTSVLPGVGGVGYQVGDTFTVPAASLGGTGSGFIATITEIGNDIFVQDGRKYMQAINMNGQMGIGFDSASTFGDGALILKRIGAGAHLVGYSDLYIEGHRVTGLSGAIHLAALSNSPVYIGEGGGDAFITPNGGSTYINSGGGKIIIGGGSVENAFFVISGSYTVPVLPGSPLGRVLYNKGVINATENNQTLIGMDFVATLNDNGFTGITKIEARFRDKVQLLGLTINTAVFTDANKNLVSVALTGSGSNVMGTAPTITNMIAAGTFSFTGGIVGLNNATSNWFLFIGAGLGAPTFTTRSAGTKSVWFPAITAAAADYATGVASNSLWNSVPTTAGNFHWYGGTALAATLSGTGNLTLPGKATVAGAPTNPTDVARKLEVDLKADKDAPVFTGVPEYTDNAAAVTAGLAINRIYRTGDLLKIVH